MQNPRFRNVQYIKDKAPAYLTALGYRLLGYEGSDPNIIFGGSVWFQAIRDDSSKLVYTIQLRKQGDGLKWQYERVVNAAIDILRLGHETPEISSEPLASWG